MYFPDLNFWIALTYAAHQHHEAAARWFARVNDQAYFCRVTQLGFLRLLTHPQVMQNEVKNQQQAWSTYDLLLTDERISFHTEPESNQLEQAWRSLSSGRRSASMQWPDTYLAAFASAAGLRVVTFDRGLHQLSGPSSVLLS